MEKVLIIGNGFDLDLGLKTSYYDFMQSPFFKNLDKSSDLMKHILFKESISKWIDLETEIKNIISSKKGFFSRGDNAKNPPFDNVFKANKDSYFQLTDALMDYLKSLDYKNLNKESIAYILLKSVIENDYFEIFSFNYTDLNDINSSLNINNCTYNHVHGSIENSDIILGFEDEVDVIDEYCFMIKSHSPYYRSSNIRQSLYKAEEIVFFGHSLGITDYHYFSDFFSEQSGNNGTPKKKKTIRIFTYDENSRQNILVQLRNMNKWKTNQLYDLNDFRIYCTSKLENKQYIEEYCCKLVNDSKKNHFTRMESIII